jgi:hypothetical protein
MLSLGRTPYNERIDIPTAPMGGRGFLRLFSGRADRATSRHPFADGDREAGIGFRRLRREIRLG